MKSFLIVIAIVIAAAVAALTGYNVWESEHGAGEAEKALSVLKPEIKKYAGLRETAVVIESPEVEKMPAIRIDGIEYIGEIRIPKLDMDLPVRAQVDYSKLKESPCRYSGSYMTDNLMICAHDYSKWFGRISELEDGDELFFTNANGEVYRYVIASHENGNSRSMDSVIRGADASGISWDIALATCNMGGQADFTAWCVRAEDD